MNNYAQDWANKITKMAIPNHRPLAEKIYGENIFGTSRLENLGEAAVDSWYGEIIDYHIDDDENTLSDNEKICKFSFFFIIIVNYQHLTMKHHVIYLFFKICILNYKTYLLNHNIGT